VWVVSNGQQSKEKPMKRIAFAVGTAVLGLTGLAACGGSGGGYGSDSAPQNTSTSQSGSGAAKLATAEVGDFGKIVVDGTGRTLYVFDKDTASPSKSNCEGDCLAKWPAVLAGTGTPQLDGVDASLVGTVARSDGTTQVTLAGLPLYQFASDTKAGDAKGQAVGGVWWVVGADGKKITKQASGDTGY
jgi:predicted lipoprotein with Yx(FWY)xxD motif